MSKAPYIIGIVSFIVISLMYGWGESSIKALREEVDSITSENVYLSEAVQEKEELEAKRIELGYLFPIHVEDWIPGLSALTSAFGEREDNEAGGLSDGYHEGLDLWGVDHSGPTWMARVIAVADGWAEHWVNDPIKGRYIVVHHDDGNESQYHHLSKAYIKDGDRVTRGQVISRMGNTGISTGPHLHFQLEIDGKLVNPLKYIEIPKE